MAEIYLLQKIKGFLKLNPSNSDLERVIVSDFNEGESVETKLREYCKKYNISRKRALKELGKFGVEAAKRAAYRMRVNNGGFIHNCC